MVGSGGGASLKVLTGLSACICASIWGNAAWLGLRAEPTRERYL